MEIAMKASDFLAVLEAEKKKLDTEKYVDEVLEDMDELDLRGPFRLNGDYFDFKTTKKDWKNRIKDLTIVSGIGIMTL